MILSLLLSLFSKWFTLSLHYVPYFSISDDTPLFFVTQRQTENVLCLGFLFKCLVFEYLFVKSIRLRLI